MSTRLLLQAWRVPDLTPSTKVVLLGLADAADAGGFCRVSFDDLQRACRVDKQTLTKAMRQLFAQELALWHDEIPFPPVGEAGRIPTGVLIHLGSHRAVGPSKGHPHAGQSEPVSRVDSGGRTW